MADTDTWMPLYIGDWLGATQRLTAEQTGAYIQILIDYWRNGPPPDDDDVLRQITKLDKARWKKARTALQGMFQISNGVWKHKRVEEELRRAKEHAERRSKKAKTAAEARWANAPSNARSNARSMLEECPTPSPSPSQEEKEDNTPPSNYAAREKNEPTPHGALAFSGWVIRINQRDFDAWEKTYHGIPDLRATLTSLDEWISDCAKDDHTVTQRWRRMVTAQLDRKHQKFLASIRRDGEAGDWSFDSPC